jgi:hypothetical protein
MAELQQIATKLSEGSLKRLSNPYTEFTWPKTIDINKWQFSPDLISLYGTDVYNSLDESQQKKLAFWEAVNFFSINIHGERALIQGLAGRLYKQWPAAISGYLHHFLDEENKHMVLFGTFCETYGKKVYPDKKVNIPAEYIKGEEDFLFFAKVVIFEEMVDSYNSHMARDERVDTLARQINDYHHKDETRHLAFGREITKTLFADFAASWDEQTLARVRQYLADYMAATWKEYYNPGVYRDAGLADAYDLYESALLDPVCKSHRENISANCIKFFIDNNILLEAPEL